MMTQYGYLRTNKFEREVQIFISCKVLCIMTQYTYLRTNKFEREVQILTISNVLYMTMQYVYLRNNKFKGDTRWRFERVIILRSSPTYNTNPLTASQLAKKMANHGSRRLLPLALPMGWRRPNQVHRPHPNIMGMVQAWVGQKRLKCDILRLFTMSDLLNI